MALPGTMRELLLKDGRVARRTEVFDRKICACGRRDAMGKTRPGRCYVGVLLKRGTPNQWFFGLCSFTHNCDYAVVAVS